MKKIKLILFLAILLLAFCAYLYWIYFNISRPQLVGWDEAGFIGVGNKFHQLIKKGDGEGFWILTKKEVYYPFFQGWFLGLIAQPFYYTIKLARLISLMLLLPSVFLFYYLVNQIAPKSKPASFLALFWFLTSPTIIFLYSTTLKEGLGLTLTLACLASYFVGKKKKNRWFYFLAGLIMTLATLTKYYYGLMLIVAFLLELAISLVSQKKIFKSDFWIDLYSLFFLPAIVLSFWLWAIPGNWKEFFRYLKNVPDSFIGQLSHLLYYPMELVLGYTLSWSLFLIIFLGFIYALVVKLKDPKVRILAILFLLNFFLALRSQYKNQARYIFSTTPMFFLIGSFGAGEIYSKLIKAKNKLILGALIPFLLFGGVIIGKDLLNFPQIVRANASRQFGMANFYEEDYQKINRFSFRREDWAISPPPLGHERIEDIFYFILDQVDVLVPVNQVGQSNEISPYLFNYYLEKARENPPIANYKGYREYFVTFEFKPGSRFDTLDYRQGNAWTAQRVKAILEERSLKKIAEKEFPYLGIKVTILGIPIKK